MWHFTVLFSSFFTSLTPLFCIDRTCMNEKYVDIVRVASLLASESPCSRSSPFPLSLVCRRLCLVCVLPLRFVFFPSAAAAAAKADQRDGNDNDSPRGSPGDERSRNGGEGSDSDHSEAEPNGACFFVFFVFFIVGCERTRRRVAFRRSGDF